jgi:hypothetical protein
MNGKGSKCHHFNLARLPFFPTENIFLSFVGLGYPYQPPFYLKLSNLLKTFSEKSTKQERHTNSEKLFLSRTFFSGIIF